MLSRLRTLVLAAAAVAAVLIASPAFAQPAPLRIGIILSFTGGAAFEAKSSAAVIAAWTKLHGDTVAGRKVEFIIRDDTGLAPEVARRLAQDLIVNEHVDFLVGTNLTPNAIAVSHISTEAKKPFFIVNAATSNIIKDAPYSARFGFTTQQIVPPLAAYAAKNYGKTAYAIYQNYGPGIDASKAFQRVFTDNGGTIVGEGAIPVNTMEFSAYVQRVKEAKPAVLFVFVNASGGADELLKELATAGIAKSGTKIVATGDIVEEFGLPGLTNPPLGLVTTFNYSRAHDSATNKQFVQAFQAAYGDNSGPDFAAVAEWDALHAVWNVAQALKGDVSDPDKVMALVRGMKIDSPRGPVTIDASTRGAVQNVYLRRLDMVGGQLQNVEFATFPNVKDPTETY